MSDSTETAPDDPQLEPLPDALREALVEVARYGPGAAAVSVALGDREIMVEVTMFDITDWQDEQ